MFGRWSLGVLVFGVLVFVLRCVLIVVCGVLFVVCCLLLFGVCWLLLIGLVRLVLVFVALVGVACFLVCGGWSLAFGRWSWMVGVLCLMCCV